MIDTKSPEFKTAFDNESKRRAFIGDNFPGLPEVFHDQIGNDPTKWADEAKAAMGNAIKIRDAYNAQQQKLDAGAPNSGFLKMPGTATPAAAK